MAGARPLALTAGFVLEEGFPLECLREVVASMARAASESGVRVVAGDTKVVERGHGDGVYVNTTGVGLVLPNAAISPSSVRPGDVVLVSGDLGRHGTAVMTSREGLELDSDLSSDSASVSAAALALLEAGLPVRCMRDPTRGGLASVLNEIAAASGVCLRIHEALVPVREDVAGVCELLGLDPLYVASEGRFSVFLAPEGEEEALRVLRGFEVSQGACRVGEAAEGSAGVLLRTTLGVDRILDLLSGEQLPRIC
jgi:hydrogenase expression/formation protein HypE